MKKEFRLVPYGDTPYHTGLAIPVFSLRSENDFGVGQFSDLKALADITKASGLDIIQILPINDTNATQTFKDSSPYTATSVFALHPLYLDLTPFEKELDSDSLTAYQKEKATFNQLEAVDYPNVIKRKLFYARKVFDKLKKSLAHDKNFKTFKEEKKSWLEAYACFNYYLNQYDSNDFTDWKDHAVYQDHFYKELQKNAEAKDFLDFQAFLQFVLHQQLLEATQYCHSIGVAIKGDIAIGVGLFSADAWQNPDLFNLDMQAGAPPDAFSTTGQNWALPTYNWTRMAEDGYAWWKARLNSMATYFDAYRLDHILGFFRIWEIPTYSVRGLLGHFTPARGYSVEELEQIGIPFRAWGGEKRFVEPFIKDWVIDRIFGRDQRDRIIQNYLNYIGYENYELKEPFKDQKTIEALDVEEYIKDGLYQLTENVLLIKDHETDGYYHPRVSLTQTISYQELGYEFQEKFDWLHNDYFYYRNNHFWKEKALEKLPVLKNATDMLACGEDLGMVPATVPEVMAETQILKLAVERMPDDPAQFVHHLDHLDYLCVATPSSHDTSTLRQWWQEDLAFTQQYYNQIMHFFGETPQEAGPEVIENIIYRHLNSNAMIVIFPLQDLFALNTEVSNPNQAIERINDPSNPKNSWDYRMHLSLEQLSEKADFIQQLHHMVTNSRRSSKG